MKRFRIFLIIAGIALATLVIIGLVVNVVLVLYTGSQLEQKLEAIRAAGDPIALQDLAGPSIPTEENAATFLRRAHADIRAVGKELASVDKRRNRRFDKLSDEDTKTTRAALAAYPRLLPLLEQAAACHDYNSNLDFTAGTDSLMQALIDQAPEVRGAVNHLAERVSLQLTDGKHDEALRNCVMMLRLARHQERDPMMVNHLVVCNCRAIAVDAANRVLRSGRVSPQARADLDVELVQADNVKAFVRCLKTERVYGMEAIRTQVGGSWLRVWVNDELCYYLDLFTEFIAIAPNTYADAKSNYARIRQFQSSRHMLSNLGISAVEKVHEADIRTRAQVRCLRVLNALQQKTESDATGTPKLDQLGLPSEATLDPYTGQPLHVRREAGTWLIYADGKDLADDGGQLEGHKDVGVGPVGSEGARK